MSRLLSIILALVVFFTPSCGSSAVASQPSEIEKVSQTLERHEELLEGNTERLKRIDKGIMNLRREVQLHREEH